MGEVGTLNMKAKYVSVFFDLHVMKDFTYEKI